MAYQFVHLETYGRKPDKAGRSVGYVLDEASRQPGASLHVDAPVPPDVVHGLPLDELRTLHDQRVEAAVVIDSNGKPRRVRVDQHTLGTIVASHPGDGSPDDLAKWERLTVQWMRDTYGERLVSVVRHADEAHPHLHAYLLPDNPDLKARAMHPGVVAKDQARRAAEAAGDDGKTANKKGDAAYRAAMRGWQDSYWEAVGLPCGLARLGPGRRRMSRAGWKAEQHQVRHAAELMDKVAQLEATAAVAGEVVGRGRAVVSALHDQVAEARAARDAALQTAEAAKVEADRVVAEARSSAATVIAKARKQAADILVLARREAERLRGVGAALGGFVQGILGSSPSKVEDLVRADERERARSRESELLSANKAIRVDLAQVTRERDDARGILRQVVVERDVLRATVSRWNPEPGLALGQRPTEH